MKEKCKKALEELLGSIRNQITFHSIDPNELAKLVYDALRNAGADYNTTEEVVEILWCRYVFSSSGKIIVEVQKVPSRFKCELTLVNHDYSTELLAERDIINIEDSKISREKQIKQLFCHIFEIKPRMNSSLFGVIKDRIQAAEYREYFKQ